MYTTAAALSDKIVSLYNASVEELQQPAATIPMQLLDLGQLVRMDKLEERAFAQVARLPSWRQSVSGREGNTDTNLRDRKRTPSKISNEPVGADYQTMTQGRMNGGPKSL